MPIGIHIDACHSSAVLAGRADAQDTPVARARVHFTERLTGEKEVLAPEVMDFFYLKMPGAHRKTRWPRGLPFTTSASRSAKRSESAERPPPWLSVYWS